MQEHPSHDLPLGLKAGIDAAFAVSASTPDERRQRAEAMRLSALPAGPKARRVGRYGERRGVWIAGAAAAVAMVGLLVLLPNRSGKFASHYLDHTYVTGSGQRATITLTDGTRVILAPHSKLTLEAGYGATARTVALVGEAYFMVSRKATLTIPFAVRTGAVTTRVLGTAFDVARYAADRDVRVVVVEGRVTAGAGHMVTLSAGTMGRISDSSATVFPVADAGQYTTWTTGQLRFDEAPVPDVLARLGTWYGLRFALADSTLARQHVTAVFDGTSRAGMLAALGSLLDVTPALDSVTMTVTLRPRRSVAVPAQPRDARPWITTPMERGR